MDKKILKAEVRKLSGRKVKTLRQKGLLPGNVYGKNVKSLAVQVSDKDFKEIYDDVGETGLFELDIDGDKRPVLVHNLQFNPKSDKTIHIDFRQVDLKEKVEAEVPVELTGESPAEKQAIGTVVQYINEIKVEALPGDLPEKFVIDVTELSEVDQAVYVKDIKVDRSKVEVKDDAEAIVVKVEPPQKEEVVEAPVAAEGEVSPEGAAATEGQTEGAAPTEGQTPKEEPQK